MVSIAVEVASSNDISVYWGAAVKVCRWVSNGPVLID